MPLLLPGDVPPLYLCSVIHPHTSLSINLVVTVSIPDWQLRLAALHWSLLFRLLSHKKLFKTPSLVTSSTSRWTLLLESHVVFHYSKFIPSDVDSITKPRLSYQYLRSCCFSCASLDQQSIYQYSPQSLHIASPIA